MNFLNKIYKSGGLLFPFLLVGCQQPVAQAPAEKEDLKILISSDLHYLSEELTDHGELFQTMIENSDAKAVEFDEEIVDEFINEVIEQKPDALVLTGDLTFNGEKLSHEELADKLRKIEEAGTEVFVIPGNHDLYNPISSSYEGSQRFPAENISAEDFEEIYEDFGYGQAIETDPNSLSYVAPLSEDTWLLMIDVNTREEPGRVKDETLEWIEGQLMKAESQDIRVITASHQNLVQHNLLLADGYVMENHANLLRMLEKYGVPVHLSGHMHMQHTEVSPEGLIEIASGSLVVNPLQYGILELTEDGFDYETRILENLDQEVLDYAYDLIYRSAYESAFETTGREDLAAYYAMINASYFAGSLSDEMLDEEMNQGWMEYPSFQKTYLLSILEDPSSFEGNNQI